MTSMLAAAKSQHLLLTDVSWDYYDRTLRELDGRHFRITFDRGRMEIMTVGPDHETVKKAIARLLEQYSTEMDIPIEGLGELTCRREDIARGLEPDECYYVTNPPPKGTELDLTIHAPPDLAIEVEVTRGAIPKLPIYAALGVAEVWRFDGLCVRVLLRQSNETYAEVPQSRLFPRLPMEQFNRFLRLSLTQRQHDGVKALRDWCRQQASRP